VAVVYSAVKLPLLLLTTFLIGFCFFVLNLVRSAARSRAVRALLATQAGLAIILASLAPLPPCGMSPRPTRGSGAFNLLIFALAAWPHNGCCVDTIGP
jgi:hypothetical protein